MQGFELRDNEPHVARFTYSDVATMLPEHPRERSEGPVGAAENWESYLQRRDILPNPDRSSIQVAGRNPTDEDPRVVMFLRNINDLADDLRRTRTDNDLVRADRNDLRNRLSVGRRAYGWLHNLVVSGDPFPPRAILEQVAQRVTLGGDD